MNVITPPQQKDEGKNDRDVFFVCHNEKNLMKPQITQIFTDYKIL